MPGAQGGAAGCRDRLPRHLLVTHNLRETQGGLLELERQRLEHPVRRRQVATADVLKVKAR
eukprot:6806661-Pyramimonas_sp.AAC.1